METPGWLIVLYTMYSLPGQERSEDLPWGNWVMAGMFVGVEFIEHNTLVNLSSCRPFTIFTDP